MAVIKPWRPSFLFLVLIFVAEFFPLSLCQSNSPQNIETCYPTQISLTPPAISTPPPPSVLTSPGAAPSPGWARTKTIATAVVVTAVGTLLISALLFFLIHKRLRRRRKGEVPVSGSGLDSRVSGGQKQPVIMAQNEFARLSGNLKGFIVDENGLDVIYWRKLESRRSKNGLRKDTVHHLKNKAREEEGGGERKTDKFQEIPLLRGKSSTSHAKLSPEVERRAPESRRSSAPKVPLRQSVQKLQTSSSAPLPSQSLMAVPSNKGPAPSPPSPPPPPPPISSNKNVSPPPPPPPPPPQPKPVISKGAPFPSQTLLALSENKGSGLSPPPPPPPLTSANKNVGPPPPPPLPSTSANKNVGPPPPPPPPSTFANKNVGPPPPPPPPSTSANKNGGPPPPPPNPVSMKLGPKPPPATVGKPVEESSTSNADQVKLKPLHWDKVITRDTSRSMVWDKIDGGSFRFDGDLMEALFGTVATNRKSPRRTVDPAAPTGGDSKAPAKIFILDSKKSQNTAIVIKSMSISRDEIVDALMDGHGLESDVLEKLTKIAPNQEEQSHIRNFEGDSQNLADAESFLFKLLKAVPSAFTRLDTMLFRSTYDSEILHLKEYLESIESGCKELRTQGLFTKLLEAVLKAGNRMNAGTSRGNAQAFNLSALRKLSDVKSTDGKTSLLHFVVEEVVRSEGKKCVLNKNKSFRSFSRSSSKSSSNSINSDNSTSKDERMNEYMTLGLPIVGGLSAQFSNVKKAAAIDYNTFSGICSGLISRTSEIRQTLPKCAGDGGTFIKETENFLESSEKELKKLRDEQTRVMELVKATTGYYQAGGFKGQEAQPLQLFVIVKEFLDMVDQVCVGIARNQQRKKSSMATTGSPSTKSPPLKTQVRFPFPNLAAHFLSDKSLSRSSSSDDSDD